MSRKYLAAVALAVICVTVISFSAQAGCCGEVNDWFADTADKIADFFKNWKF